MNKYISVAVLLSLCLAAGAQTFNPTVVVTNTYEGKTMEAHKKDLPMSVPDSLSRFDLTFDYSVFDHPYRGAYEFVPYAMDIRPQSRPDAKKMLYINAGAGYTLHPEVDIVFSPKLKNNFQFGVYDNFRGYWGPYVGSTFAQAGTGDTYNLIRGDAFTGYDIRNQAGLDLMYDNSRTAGFAKAAFRTIVTSDNVESRVFNAADVKAGLTSDNGDKLDYNADFGFTYGWDQIHHADKYYLLSEMDINLSGGAHYELFKAMRIGGVAGFNYVSTGGEIINTGAMELFAIPQAIWQYDRTFLKVGLKMAYLFSFDTINKADDRAPFRNFRQPSGYLFPDVEFSYRLIDRNLDVFVKATGGNDMASYGQAIEGNHFFKPTYFMMKGPVMDNSVEKFNGTAGLRFGSSHFQAEVAGGYVTYLNGRLDSFFLESDLENASVFNGYSYVNYDQRYLQARLLWDSARLNASAYAKLRDTKIRTQESFYGVLPSKLVAGGSITANLNHRLYAGVTAEYATERDAYFASIAGNTDLRVGKIPSYLDLGCNARFDFSDGFSVWARLSNILNSNVQRTIGRAYDGLFITGGICLNF
ncbi:MAG: hypothetical protein J6Y61_02420 [Bacteroidales bacterium]|nr:hypothetical protein [Bacteroidales bacterium]